MKDTKTLKYAYKVRNDEFYTYLEDIEAELQHYDFEDKIEAIGRPAGGYRQRKYEIISRENQTLSSTSPHR